MQPAKNCVMSIIRCIVLSLGKRAHPVTECCLCLVLQRDWECCYLRRYGCLTLPFEQDWNWTVFLLLLTLLFCGCLCPPPPSLPPIFRGSNVIGQINIILNKLFTFNILLIILCRQWLPYVWNSWTSPKTGFLPLWYFARTLRQPTVFCLFVGLSAFSFVFSKWMHTQSGWDKEIGLANAE